MIFAISTGIGALVASRVPGILGTSLDVRTDILGYPIVAAFDAYQYTNRYYAAVVAFPIVTLVVYALFARMLRLRATETALPAPAAEDLAASTERPRWTAALLSGIVAFTFGVEAMVIVGERVSRPAVLVGVGLLYLSLLAGAILLLPRPTPVKRALARIATINALACPLLVLGLYGVSRATKVTVVANQSVHHFSWFPAWVAALVGIVLLGLAARTYRGARDEDDVIRLGRRMVTYVAAPVLLFLFTAALPDAVGFADWFHEGEGLVPARLVMHGAFPYRDFVAIHGPIQDVLVRLLGIEVFQDSLWGARAGVSVLLVPLYWIALYFLNARLYRRNWIFLVTPFVLVIAGMASFDGMFAAATYVRFVFLPFALLLFSALLRRPTVTRAVAFMSLLTVQVVGSPEAAFAVPGFAIALIGYEWYYREPGRPVLAVFHRTRLCAITGLGTTALTIIVLAANNALGSFIDYFTTFSRGHALTGALPLIDGPTLLAIEIYVPIAAVLLTFWFFCARIRGRRSLTIDDWTMLPAAILLLLYIPKWLIRGDPLHLVEGWAVSLPLVCYVLYRATGFLERGVRRYRAGVLIGRWSSMHFVSLIIALALVVPAAHILPRRLRFLDVHYASTAPEAVQLSRLGFSQPGVEGTAVARDVKSIVSTVTSRNDQVFDFTNAPGYFYYLLGYDTPTRYYHVSTAIRADTQTDLISELRSSHPAIVVYEGVAGLPIWDGITSEVRHYDVSTYLLDHYRPMARYLGFLFLLRNEISDPKAKLEALNPASPIELNNLYAKSNGCAWGRAPDNLDRRPASGASRTAPLPVRRETVPHSVREVISVPSDAASYGWIEITADTGFRDDAFTLAPSGVARVHRITFATSERSPHEYLVKVGSCIQWRGWKGTELVLTHGHPQDITSVRLVR